MTTQAGKIITQEEYEKYKNMIWKEALNWHKKTNIELNELLAQGNLIFCESILKYDEVKSSFSTFLTLKLWQGLTKYCNMWRMWSRLGLIVNHKLVSLPRTKNANNRKRTKYYKWTKQYIFPADLSNEELEQIDFPYIDNFEYNIQFRQWKEQLSKNAKEIVDIATGTDLSDTLKLVGSEPVRVIRGAIVKYLREVKYWKWNTIWTSFREVKTALKEM